MFEYSGKGLPHCLMHARELLETGGHHGAYNTSIAEASHPDVIKDASKFSQTLASKNDTHEGMLSYVCWQRLWKAAIERNEVGVVSTTRAREFQPLTIPLPFTQHWSETEFTRGRPPRDWSSTFISKHVLITQEELVTLLLHKLGLDHSAHNFMLVVKKLKWQCYGAWSQQTPDGKRTFVGFMERHPRRDFARLRGVQSNTVLTVAIKMFVNVSGFGHGSGIFLPRHLRAPDTNENNCVFAVVRWLSPHPDALLRDSQFRPICPAPFDINHALWTFSKRVRARRVFRNRRNITRQAHLFSGPDTYQLDRAMYDMIEVPTIDHLVNCTCFDDHILETLTLPF